MSPAEHIEQVLFGGSADEIAALTCPRCGGNVWYSWGEISRSLSFGCRCIESSGYGVGETPNCVALNGPDKGSKRLDGMSVVKAA